MKKLPIFINSITKVIAVGFSAWQIYVLSVGTLDPVLSRRIFVAWLLMLVYLLELNKSPNKYKKDTFIFNCIAVILSLITCWYYFVSYERLVTRWPMVSTVAITDILIGIVLIILILVGVKRYTGWPLVGIVVGFICYGYIGNTLSAIIDQLTLTFYGIFSTPISVASTLVFAFVLFGSLLRYAGGGEFFVFLANKLFGKSRGGPAKVAVVGSMLMGSISGAPSANVVTTGTVTIPLMKKMGFTAEYAGAVEAVASTGGAIMPPIMGSAAFIMSELAGIPYTTIISAALIPAILYFVAIYISVDLKAAKLGLKASFGDNESIKTIELISGIVRYFTPLALIIILLFKGISPAKTGILASGAMIILSWINYDTRLTPIKILKSLEDTAKSMLMIMLTCSAAGIVLGMINLTGISSHVIGNMMVSYQGSTLSLLLLTMIITIILGMGMPNSATYILVAALMAPALINMGVPVMIAHLFIIFFSSISHITPPVMIAGFAAATIAEAEPMRLGINNLLLGFVAFVVPYFMVYEPALIGQGSMQLVILAFLSACVGIYFIVLSIEGWLGKIQPTVYRIIWLLCGLLLLYPGFVTDILGFIVGSGFILIALRKTTTKGISISNMAK